jgi:hypothetical protein
MTPLTRAQAILATTAPGQPYELEAVTVGTRRLRVFRNAPRSLRAIYADSVSDLPFLVYEDERLSFAQAWAQASRIGHLLVHEAGVRPGDRVAISMRNYPEWIRAFTAITSPSRRSPRSPCSASWALSTTAVAPVEFIVAAIFWPTFPDFPTPTMTTLPRSSRESRMSSTAF